jgi:hypothetical protein
MKPKAAAILLAASIAGVATGTAGREWSSMMLRISAPPP